MRAIVYCRVSTSEQATDDHYSLAAQEDRGRQLVKERDWRLVKVRKDVASGKDSDRQGYQELLADVAHRRIDVVVVYRLDRLSRNVRDIYDFLDRIGEHDVAFVSWSEGFDTTTAMGRAMLGMAAVFAQLTREMIAENVREGLAKRFRMGKYTGATNPPPFGYDYDREQGQLLINAQRAATVRQIFDWYRNAGFGLTKIAQQLNRQGLAGPRASRWYRSTVSHILHSPLYAGKLRQNDEVVEGEHEAIIDDQTFQSTQELIRERSRLPSRSQTSQHLLAGLARCGRCGKRLHVHQVRAENKAGVVVRHYYRHAGDWSRAEVGCRGISKSQLLLEEAVIGYVAEVAGSPELRQLALAEAAKELEVGLRPLQQERQRLQQEQEKLNGRFSEWAERLDEGLIDDEQFAQRNRRLLERKTGIEERLREIDIELARHESSEVVLTGVQQALADFDRTWAHLTADEQRELVRALIERVDVHGEHADVKLYFMPRHSIAYGGRSGKGKGSRRKCSPGNS